MAKKIIKTDYSPYHTGAKAVLYDDGSYVNYDPDGNVVDYTTVDDDTLDRETWSYNQNEYANRYITNANKSTRPDLVTRSNNTSNTSTRTSNRQSVKQNKGNNNNIVTIGTRSFGDAFKQARKAGLDKFRWKGRVYGTKYANEVGNSNTPNRRTTTKPVTKYTTKPTTNSQSNTNRTTNTSRTTYTRDNNDYAQLHELTVTVPARQTRPTNTSRTTNTSSTPRRYSLPQIQGYNSRLNNTSNGTSLNPTLDDTFRMINQANSRRTSFYDARKAAQAQGKKSFVYNGNTYSSYGATSSPVGKYSKKKK